MKKAARYIYCILISVCLFLILLINAFDYSIYYRPHFYEKTFKKYNVTQDAQMQMSDAVALINYLTGYLKGNKTSLEDYRTVVNGEERLFYSQRELLHMQDVKVLFLQGLAVRRICTGIVTVLILLMLLLRTRFILTLAKTILTTFLSLLACTGILTAVIASNFSRAFTAFHKIFFNNDLWLLNPEEDWIIRLLPEGFFLDMIIVIGIVFVISLLAVSALCGGLLLHHKHHTA